LVELPQFVGKVESHIFFPHINDVVILEPHQEVLVRPHHPRFEHGGDQQILDVMDFSKIFTNTHEVAFQFLWAFKFYWFYGALISIFVVVAKGSEFMLRFLYFRLFWALERGKLVQGGD
jgi:hypothetical protein